MTQELVLAGLLTGLIGLVWVMTLAIWDGKQTAGQAHDSEPSGDNEERHHRKGALRQQTIAA